MALPLIDEIGQACASNDWLGPWKILQRRELEDVKEACSFVTKACKHAALMRTSITPGCLWVLKKLEWKQWERLWQGWLRLLPGEPGGRGGVSCPALSEVGSRLPSWAIDILRASVCQGLFISPWLSLYVDNDRWDLEKIIDLGKTDFTEKWKLTLFGI